VLNLRLFGIEENSEASGNVFAFSVSIESSRKARREQRNTLSKSKNRGLDLAVGRCPERGDDEMEALRKGARYLSRHTL